MSQRSKLEIWEACLDIINHLNLINDTAVTYRRNQHCNLFQRGLQESKLAFNTVSCRHFYMVGTFKGFGRDATIKFSSSLTPKIQIALSVLLVSKETEGALYPCESKAFAQPLCTSAHATRSVRITQSQRVFSAASPPERCSQRPPAFMQERRKVEDFLQWFLKTKPPGEDTQITFCHLIQCKAQGNPRNDCFSLLRFLKDIQTP